MFQNIADRFEEYISVVLLFFFFLLMLGQVIGRYLFGISFGWVDEVSRYSLVWFSFIGAAFARKNGRHLKIEVMFNFISKHSPITATVITILSEILIFLFIGYLIYQGIIYSLKSWVHKSPALDIPAFYLYISLSVGLVFFLIREIQSLFLTARKHKEER